VAVVAVVAAAVDTKAGKAVADMKTISVARRRVDRNAAPRNSSARKPNRRSVRNSSLRTMIFRSKESVISCQLIVGSEMPLLTTAN
jgi:hypothetical protein